MSRKKSWLAILLAVGVMLPSSAFASDPTDPSTGSGGSGPTVTMSFSAPTTGTTYATLNYSDSSANGNRLLSYELDGKTVTSQVFPAQALNNIFPHAFSEVLNDFVSLCGTHTITVKAWDYNMSPSGTALSDALAYLATSPSPVASASVQDILDPCVAPTIGLSADVTNLSKAGDTAAITYSDSSNNTSRLVSVYLDGTLNSSGPASSTMDSSVAWGASSQLDNTITCGSHTIGYKVWDHIYSTDSDATTFLGTSPTALASLEITDDQGSCSPTITITLSPYTGFASGDQATFSVVDSSGNFDRLWTIEVDGTVVSKNNAMFGLPTLFWGYTTGWTQSSCGTHTIVVSGWDHNFSSTQDAADYLATNPVPLATATTTDDLGTCSNGGGSGGGSASASRSVNVNFIGSSKTVTKDQVKKLSVALNKYPDSAMTDGSLEVVIHCVAKSLTGSTAKLSKDRGTKIRTKLRRLGFKGKITIELKKVSSAQPSARKAVVEFIPNLNP